MSKDKVKIGVAAACLVVAGVVLAWQFGVFGGRTTPGASSETQAAGGGEHATGSDTTQGGEGITLTNPGGFIPPEPRSR